MQNHSCPVESIDNQQTKPVHLVYGGRESERDSRLFCYPLPLSSYQNQGALSNIASMRAIVYQLKTPNTTSQFEKSPCYQD
ncbi:hypothetical protein ACHWQZ_G005405 [Mnemiopsis leidyi]